MKKERKGSEIQAKKGGGNKFNRLQLAGITTTNRSYFIHARPAVGLGKITLQKWDRSNTMTWSWIGWKKKHSPVKISVRYLFISQTIFGRTISLCFKNSMAPFHFFSCFLYLPPIGQFSRFKSKKKIICSNYDLRPADFLPFDSRSQRRRRGHITFCTSMNLVKPAVRGKKKTAGRLEGRAGRKNSARSMYYEGS